MTDQSTDTTKLQFGEPMSFIGVTSRSRNNSKIAEPQIPHPAWVTVYKSGNVENTTQPEADQQFGGCPCQVRKLV